MSKILKITKEIKIEVDTEAKAAYIYLLGTNDDLEGKLKSEPVNADIVLDYTPEGKLFGIEILNLNLLDIKE